MVDHDKLRLRLTQKRKQAEWLGSRRFHNSLEQFSLRVASRSLLSVASAALSFDLLYQCKNAMPKEASYATKAS